MLRMIFRRAASAAALLIASTWTVLAHDLSKAPDAPVGAKPPETLHEIDLGMELPGQVGRSLRMRRVVLEPGGAIPPHGHADRPAIVYVLQGTAREHRSDMAEPLVYGAGESMTESAAVHHWVESIGEEPLIGIVVDIVNESGALAFTANEIRESYGIPSHTHE